MKSNKKKIGLVIVLVAILLAIVLGYTFSKYTQSVSVDTSTSVATWKFSGRIENGVSSSETISLADTVDSDTIVDGKIAPGTSGSFDIVIDASGSEVDIEYTIELAEEKNKPTNLTFEYNGKEYSTLESLISAISSGEIDKNETQIVTYTVNWEWPYEIDDNGDVQDLADGQSITDYTFTIKITGTQKAES